MPRITSASRFGVGVSACLMVLFAAYARAGIIAERFGFGPPGGAGSGNGFGPGSNGGANGFPGFSNGFPNFAGFDIRSAIHYRTIHGILASLALVVLFPIGSIFMRVIPGRFAIWVHALTQLIGFAIFVAAAGIGFHLVKTVQIPFNGGNLLTNPVTKFHPIVGIVTLVTLLLQPILGWIHHRRYKQLGRRTIWSHMHIWNGRFGITAGIVNGGLGLQLANAPYNIKLAYTVVAAIMWALWMITAVLGEIRRWRSSKAAPVPSRGARTPKESREGRGSRGSHGSRGSGSASSRA